MKSIKRCQLVRTNAEPIGNFIRFQLERWLQRGAFHQLLLVTAVIILVSVLGGLTAFLASANLANADLSNVNLTDTGLLLANFSKADLNNANLSGAGLFGATLTGVKSGGITGTPGTLPDNWIWSSYPNWAV